MTKKKFINITKEKRVNKLIYINIDINKYTNITKKPIFQEIGKSYQNSIISYITTLIGFGGEGWLATYILK